MDNQQLILEEQLRNAVEAKNLPLTEQLLEQGVSPNNHDRIYNPITNACLNNDWQMVNLLIKHGADIHERNVEGHDALGVICAQNTLGSPRINVDLYIIKLLIGNKANLVAQDKNGNTPLHNLVQGGVDQGKYSESDKEKIQYLLERPDSRQLSLENNKGEKALDILLRNRSSFGHDFLFRLGSGMGKVQELLEKHHEQYFDKLAKQSDKSFGLSSITNSVMNFFKKETAADADIKFGMSGSANGFLKTMSKQRDIKAETAQDADHNISL